MLVDAILLTNIALTVYGCLALCTYLYIMTDEEVQKKGIYFVLFFVLSLFWPLVWLIYYAADDN